jgi:hypothetical protein
MESEASHSSVDDSTWLSPPLSVTMSSCLGSHSCSSHLRPE